MITETVINLYPIIKYIGIFAIAGTGLFLLHNLGGMKIFSKHDNQFADKFLDKYPLVNPEFYDKSAKQRDIENNQEIHELNKRTDALEANYAYIAKQLKQVMGEIKKNG